jgi:23S rRNA (adenine2030-N6)-methyltransferase
VHHQDSPQGLNGSGLAIANPPWGLEDELKELLPWLAKELAQTAGSYRMDWLIAE